MEYFLSIDGGQTGPHTQYEVSERIRDGRAKGGTLAWKKGLSGWTPLKELTEFSTDWPVTPDIIKAAEEARNYARMSLDMPQPWPRFWARVLDYFWFSIAIWLLCSAALPVPVMRWLLTSTLHGAPLEPLFMLAFVPVEAWFISRRGTTPGKMLLRVHVSRQDGKLSTYAQALKRSLQVYVLGVGLWLPFVPFITMSIWRIRLLRNKTTLWDASNGLRVEHGEVDEGRYFFVFVVVVVLTLVAGFLFGLNPAAEELTRGLQQ